MVLEVIGGFQESFLFSNGSFLALVEIMGVFKDLVEVIGVFKGVFMTLGIV